MSKAIVPPETAGLIPTGHAEAVKMTMSLPNGILKVVGKIQDEYRQEKTSTILAILFNSSILEREILRYAQPHQHQRFLALAELLSENHRSCDPHMTPSLSHGGQDHVPCHAMDFVKCRGEGKSWMLKQYQPFPIITKQDYEVSSTQKSTI